MAKGPKGERRPADVNARAVMIAKIATGEIEDATINEPLDLFLEYIPMRLPRSTRASSRDAWTTERDAASSARGS